MNRIGRLFLFVSLSLWSCFPSWASAQTAPPKFGETCTFSWIAPTVNEDDTALTDLAGYRAWVVEGAAQLPVVFIPKAQTSTTCAALGVKTDGLKTFTVVSVDDAGNASKKPSTIQATRDTVSPAAPGGLSITSPQPIALFITPNPAAKQTTVSWIPGSCKKAFIVSRLVSGRWIELGRTSDTWLDVPLVNSVNQPYGVTAVCEG